MTHATLPDPSVICLMLDNSRLSIDSVESGGTRYVIVAYVVWALPVSCCVIRAMPNHTEADWL